ncbi:MAG: hypothetical protein PVI46_08500 [Lysobacterales bacterium]
MQTGAGMLRSLFACVLGLGAACWTPVGFAGDCTVLLHGLWRSENSMNRMAESLEKAGYPVRNIAYDSTEEPIEDLASDAVNRGLAACKGSPQVNFVTHSLGGILVRQYLEQHDIGNLGRVVMLGPPNQGSEVVDQYGNLPGFEWIGGPAGLQLGTGQASVPRALGRVHFDLGVIAGTRSINPILSQSLPGADDGKVSVASTRVDGMQDHLQIPVSHMFMASDRDVIEQVIYYLDHGRFERNPQAVTSGKAD